MTGEYIPRLLQYLKDLDFSISGAKDLLPKTLNTMQVYGLVETIAVYEGEKVNFLRLFPEVREHYEKALESKLKGDQ